MGFVARCGRKTFYCDGWLASDLAVGFENESRSNLTPERDGKREPTAKSAKRLLPNLRESYRTGKIYIVADSESNIIREINFQKETVETLVGGDLYDFGDEDGEGDDVRLQHPLGVAIYGDQVLLADTYNHKIKLLNPVNKTVKTFLGTGKAGQTDGLTAQFYEPGGISIADGKLFIADTNNHAVRVVDLKTKEVSTLKIEGLTPPIITETETESYSPNLKEFKSDIAEHFGKSKYFVQFQYQTSRRLSFERRTRRTDTSFRAMNLLLKSKAVRKNLRLCRFQFRFKL